MGEVGQRGPPQQGRPLIPEVKGLGPKLLVQNQYLGKGPGAQKGLASNPGVFVG